MPSNIEAQIQDCIAAFTHDLERLVKASALQAVVDALEGRERASPPRRPRRRLEVVPRAATTAELPVKTVEPLVRVRRATAAKAAKSAPETRTTDAASLVAPHVYDQARRELLAAM